MNILITSVGRRTSLIEYFKNHFEKVVVTDCSSLAPAIYKGDKYYIVPSINSDEWLAELKRICKNERIDGILSLIDPELEILARHRRELEKTGAEVIVSEEDVCRLCFDKWAMYKFLIRNGFKTPETYIDLEVFKSDLAGKRIKFPVFLKPVKGSASIGATRVENMELLEALMRNSDEELMIQSYMEGRELGVDVYTEIKSKKVISVFIKEKIKMRAGETDKAVSIKEARLQELVERFVNKLGSIGPVDIDIFERDGEYYISEVNPRFGGGYPLAYECGEKFPEMILENLKGIDIKRELGGYRENTYMMKQDGLKVIEGQEKGKESCSS